MDITVVVVLTVTVAFAVTVATMSAAVVMVLHIKENYIYCFKELHIKVCSSFWGLNAIWA